ncbi:DUF599 domain-containing protein [Shimia sp. R10_1]|uniref:DUF599 domain-containing protein n=1 Tax=Shimia sp. R10_1 TaxID=2821095 RepID=UPI001ADB4250|nr:DUF599 domain-containing protein [Shimia sp. R10_1]MBO9473877.1 DUF599 domain-containing protein [Shimia sp. R10_1]
MTMTQLLLQFSPLDFAAVAVSLIAWIVTTHLIENPPKNRPSVSHLMAFYRREWMVHYVERSARIFDAQIMGNLRQSTAFFASSSMIALGGLVALIGNTDQIAGITQDLTQTADSTTVLEIKLMLILFFVGNAFLKFVWSHRLFGYCSVLMGAVPNEKDHPAALSRADKAADVNITAARSFNRGIRAIYFGLASAAWLLGPVMLLVGISVTVIVLGRREFASQSRAALLREPR